MGGRKGRRGDWRLVFPLIYREGSRNRGASKPRWCTAPKDSPNIRRRVGGKTTNCHALSTSRGASGFSTFHGPGHTLGLASIPGPVSAFPFFGFGGFGLYVIIGLFRRRFLSLFRRNVLSRCLVPADWRAGGKSTSFGTARDLNLPFLSHGNLIPFGILRGRSYDNHLLRGFLWRRGLSLFRNRSLPRHTSGVSRQGQD